MNRKQVIPDLAAIIRRTFTKSGLSRRQLSLRSGVYYSAVHGFIEGDRDMGLDSASKLCAVLDLELRPKRARKTR